MSSLTSLKHIKGNVGRGQWEGIFNDMAAIKILHKGGYTG